MNNYKIYIYDESIRQEYPVTTYKDNINELCFWLNNLINRAHVTVIGGYLLDNIGGYIDELDFLPNELATQQFITDYPTRLIAYNLQVNGA